MLAAGQQINQTIRLVKPLGQGGMGNVWTAEHLSLGTLVAVKFMAPAYAQDERQVERFRQEAQAAAKLRSPHVAQVFDHGMTAEREPYIVMELLEGETLQSRLTRRGPASLGEVVRVVQHVAKALSLAHRLWVIHRDIKPDNLFLVDVEGEPFVKVLDFGIAKLLHADAPTLTSTGRTLGTPFYMSPEQFIDASNVDYRTDLWSLAVVAYQALTGKLPFVGEAVGALAVAVHAGNFQPPSAVRPSLPPAVDDWMTRALQRDPAARFGSARELAEALERATRSNSRQAPARRPYPEDLADTEPDAALRLAVNPKPAIPPPPANPKPAIPPPPIHPKPAKPAPLSELRIGGGTIKLVQGHIVKAGTEAIVCPTNEKLDPSCHAVCASIHRKAGPELREMTGRIGSLAPGGAALTGAGAIAPPIRFVIHAAGREYIDVSDAARIDMLRSTVKQCLLVAEDNGVRSIAFPPISTSYGYPLTTGAELMLSVSIEHLKARRSLELIVFMVLTNASYDLFAHILGAMARGPELR